MTKLLNLTPHQINIIIDGNNITIPPESTPARCKESTTITGQITLDDGTIIPVIQKTMGVIENLPEPKGGVIFIVALVVAQSAKRIDVMSIGESIRDNNSNIVGAKSLAVF